MKFPDFSLTFLVFNISLTNLQNSLTFPWPWRKIKFPCLFPDQWPPCYSYHQMCPALNSKPYCSNKWVVPLLVCCSDAPDPPWKPSGDIWGSNLLPILGSNPTWKKLLHFHNTSWPKIRPLNASFLSGLSMYSTRLPCHSDPANFFFQKLLNLTENYRFFQVWIQFVFGNFGRGPLHICNASFWNQNMQTDTYMIRYPGFPSNLV